jgi:hypothetical protein
VVHDRRMRGFIGGLQATLALVGSACGGAVAAGHPAAVSAALAAIATSVKCAAAAACVSGANASSGPGVAGSSAQGSGVRGTSSTGTGVYGTVTTPGQGTGVVGVGKGVSTGVIGASIAGDGVFATSTKGIGSYSYSSSGTGALGQSSSGTGIIAESAGGVALWAANDAFGDAIDAYTSDGVAVRASRGGSSANPAVLANNLAGTAGEFVGTTVGLVGRAPAGRASFPLVLTDTNANDVFYVDGNGNVYYHGELIKFAPLHNGATARVFNPSSAQPTMEDVGTAQLIAGSASVRLDPNFAASIDATTPYHVFLTADGDTRGLFVMAKTAAGFVVREAQGGHATTSFDYRIVATALGQSGQRMALAVKPAEPRMPLTAVRQRSMFVLPPPPPHIRLPGPALHEH